MPQLWLTFEEIADLFFCDRAGESLQTNGNVADTATG